MLEGEGSGFEAELAAGRAPANAASNLRCRSSCDGEGPPGGVDLDEGDHEAWEGGRQQGGQSSWYGVAGGEPAPRCRASR